MPTPRARSSRFLDGESRVQTRDGAVIGHIRAQLGAQVIVLRLRASRGRGLFESCPASTGERLAPERVDAEVVDTLPFNCRVQ
jgi:hypothetical protein